MRPWKWSHAKQSAILTHVAEKTVISTDNYNRRMNFSSAPLDTSQFKQALSSFATGVTVITTQQMGEPNPTDWGHQFVGLTASSFNSVSLTPPLVVWSLGLTSRTVPSFQTCSHYVINVLSDAQLHWCQQFAYGQGNRFDKVEMSLSSTGLPILNNSLAWFECRNKSQYPEGDHIIFVGEVVQCGFAEGSPLIYHQGQFTGIAK
jgi:flavin reductase (DIM6/NTAB) family NADH-FMN oxidoreductase RutF